jgi:hypothetical protein
LFCAYAGALVACALKSDSRLGSTGVVVRPFIFAVFIFILALSAAQAVAKTHRDPAQRAAFVKMHPCPSTGKTRGRCPGYVVDHVMPLCAGGRDQPSNMQWQTQEEAKNKDRKEREMCRK